MLTLMKNIAKKNMHTAQELHSQELHIFYNHLELNYKSFYFNVILLHQYFHYILQLTYQLTIFYTYTFYNLNILQHHMIDLIHIHNC